VTRPDVTQCAVLVGGLATRLGPIAAQTPKCLLDVSGRPFLAWLMREMVRFGVREFVLLAQHLSDRLEQTLPALAAHLPKQVEISVAVEPIKAGTGGAVFHAVDRLHDHFLLCNGDSLLDFNLGRLLAAAAVDPPQTIGHMLLRQLPDTSRFGVVSMVDGAVIDFAERRPIPGPGLINAGVYVMDRRIARWLQPECSLERDVLPRLAREGLLRGTVGGGYFVDIGVEADLHKAREELSPHLARDALFVDAEALSRSISGDETDERPTPAAAALARASDAGWRVFAMGSGPEADRLARLVRRCGGAVDEVIRGSNAAGRAELVRDVIRRWELDPGRCALLSDSAPDLAAIAAAGMSTRWMERDVAAQLDAIVSRRS
jgi:dTDP-glucose pyrophosphorylase